MPEARYTYCCAKCGGSVSKTPCVKGGTAGLCGWSCAKCGRGIKVARKLAKEKPDGADVSLKTE